MQRFLRTGRARISRTSQKVQSYLFIFFPSVDERLFSIIRPEKASPSSPENEYQVMAKSHPTRRPGANNMPLPSCHGPAAGMPPSRRTINGSVRKLGCKQQAYAHSFVNLKRKKGISATPLNWLLNAFTLALNDSAPALVCLFTK